ncbi:hypothetical protein [Streptomyces xanthophaeus]|uniref:hypothetical protein n=1 Tax=Streptomyces xanthophaeus TaxID=67385 RepID=UPI003714A304
MLNAAIWRCSGIEPRSEPAEHCGAIFPAFGEQPPAECVLRPGHQGSHANEYDTRWIETARDTCLNDQQLLVEIGYPVRCPHCPEVVPPTHWTKHVQRHHPEEVGPPWRAVDLLRPAATPDGPSKTGGFDYGIEIAGIFGHADDGEWHDVSDGPVEPADPTKCSGEEGLCSEHGFHRHALKQPADQPELRQRYAKALYEYANPGHQWEDAHPDDLHCYGGDGYAVLAVRDDELTAAKARADQAEAGLEAVRQRAARFARRIDYARDWARRNLPADQQERLLKVLRGDIPTRDSSNALDPPKETP